MTRPAIAVLISCLSVFPLPLASAATTGHALPQALANDNFRDVLVQAGDRLFIAGQPTEAGLEQLADAGVVTVVNLRTHREMNDRGVVPFDEAAKVAELDLKYVHIPSGGPETPYAPDMVDRFAEVMATTEGKVLLHCTVAWRASHLYVAYLHEHLGLPLAEAVRHGQAINFGTLPLEGFLGTPLSIEAGSVGAAAPEPNG
jgi:uncharacterized protein (TIGR01244 family)